MHSDTHPTTGEAVPVERADDDVSWQEALPIRYRYRRAAFAGAARVKLLVASSMQPMADYVRRPNAP